MKGAGLTFNMMTLGGLAAGIGLFIDDAIVMIEAIHRELATGESTATAVSAALKHLGRPLFASTMTVIVVFAPLVFLFRRDRRFLAIRSPRRSAAGSRFRWCSRLLFHTGDRTRDGTIPAQGARTWPLLSQDREHLSVHAAALRPAACACGWWAALVLGRGRVRGLQQPWHRLSAAARRRRIHPRLHNSAARARSPIRLRCSTRSRTC